MIEHLAAMLVSATAFLARFFCTVHFRRADWVAGSFGFALPRTAF